MPTPTAAECALFRTRYTEADDALHRLIAGAAEVRVRFDGKEVEYNRASMDELRRYVEYLRQRVAQCDGTSRSPRSLIGVVPTN